MLKRQNGYTLVEVVLFFAITGLVMAVLLVGSGTALNQRRYQDAATSLTSYIQNQYNLATNINSSRDVSEACVGGSVVIDATSTVQRGTSSCTIVGRMFWGFTDADGTGIKSRQVIATRDAATLPLNPSDSDAKVLQDAALTLGMQEDVYRPEWGTKLVAPSPGGAAKFSVLIARVPTTGVIHTYSMQNSSVSPSALVGSVGDIKLCLDPAGLLGASTQPVGTIIKADAANTSGVQTVSQGNC